jgi:hypothetical protein
MLTINEERTGALGSGTDSKLRVVVEGPDLEEVQGHDARDMAMTKAASVGFGNAGLTDMPAVGSIDAATDEMLDGPEALDPKRERRGYRAEYTFAKRI